MVFTISSVGLTEHDEAVLEAFLDLIGNKSEHIWNYRKYDPKAAAIVIDPHTITHLPNSPVIIAHIKENERIPEGFIKLPSPLRLKTLVEALNLAGRKLLASHEQNQTETNQRTALLPLATALYEVMYNYPPRSIYKISGGGLHRQLYVAPASKLCYLQDNVSVSQQSKALTKLQIAEIASNDSEFRKISQYPHPLNRLLWTTGMQGGAGKLFPWLSKNHYIALRRWPDFGTLEHTSAHIKLAAFLSKHPTSFSQIATGTGIEENVVADFINACTLCGFINTTNHETPKPMSEKKFINKIGAFDFITKLRRKLGI